MKLDILAFAMLCLTLTWGCGENADSLGVGAECTVADDCRQDEVAQDCLTQFKGGYCGIVDCASDEDCPRDAGCIAHEDGSNYCFRVCIDKAECNENRGVDNEANCSSNVTFVDGAMGRKACVPPSG